MSTRDRHSPRITVAVVILAMTTFTALTLAGPASAWAAAPADRGGAATPQRWTRSVCTDVATWMGARADVEDRVETVLASAGSDELTARQAKRQLARAYSRGLEAAQEFVDDVRAAGMPKVADGRSFAARYADTIEQYRGAYAEAARSLASVDLRDRTQLVAAVQVIDTTLRADLDVVGVDPIEDLRAIEALAAPIAASCHAVDVHLMSTVDPACSAALDATQLVVDAENRFQAIPVGSPEEAAAEDEFVQRVLQLRPALGACSIAGVASAPCRTFLESAQGLLAAEDQYNAAPIGSPEEAAAEDAGYAAAADLVSKSATCRR